MLFWPALFVPGGVPKFPAGTVIDAYVDGSFLVDTPDDARPVVNLAKIGALAADIDYDALTADKDPKYFFLELSRAQGIPTPLVVDNVNGHPVQPIDVEVISGTGQTTGRGRVSISKLSKHFQKGINRFEISHTDAGRREAAEVIMEIQL